jgi:hypothetical protein
MRWSDIARYPASLEGVKIVRLKYLFRFPFWDGKCLKTFKNALNSLSNHPKIKKTVFNHS